MTPREINEREANTIHTKTTTSLTLPEKKSPKEKVIRKENDREVNKVEMKSKSSVGNKVLLILLNK